jgi:isoquinoline 1-oxidoreductase subunit alpha
VANPTIQLTINGKRASFDGDPDMPLLWYLRDELALTGTKFGCGLGLCGACTVHLNGEAARSCQTPMRAAAGKRITTIEGLSAAGEHPLDHDIDATMQGNICRCGTYQRIRQAIKIAAGVQA